MYIELYNPNFSFKTNVLKFFELLLWGFRSRPSPPPHIIKEMTVISYSKLFNIYTFIETGTYFGEMVDATKNQFKQIFSIELNTELYSSAKEKFKNVLHISIINGDSGEKLSYVLKKVTENAIFWLDGHYSGGITSKGEFETPIKKELLTISLHPIKTHIILIDDARLFVGTNDYPTIDELRIFCEDIFPNHEFFVKNDIIRIIPIIPKQ